MLTTEQLAEKLGVSTGRVRQLAGAGRITHAQQFGKAWAFTEQSRIVQAERTKRLERRK